MAYRPNITARNLQASETRLFAYTWRPGHARPLQPHPRPAFCNPPSLPPSDRGYRFLVFPASTVEEELGICDTLMLEGQVDGFVLSNTDLDDIRVRRLHEAGFPFVAFGRSNPEWDFPCVDVDGTIRRASRR